jgi:hypothetical protein
MTRTDTDLPFGDAFSPGQLETDDADELAEILEMVDKYEGRAEAFDKAVAERFFPDSNEPLERSKNVRLGLGPSGYQLTSKEFRFTDVGEMLYERRENTEELYERFARHILLELDGLKVIQVIEDLQAETSRSTTVDNVKRELRSQYDMHIDDTSNHWSQMRAWLSKADIINTRSPVYDIDHQRLEEIIGLDFEARFELSEFTAEQQAFLKALALIAPDTSIPNTKVVSVAEDAYGVKIQQSNITRRVLEPLAESGYLNYENPSEVTGKPMIVETTDAFEADIVKPALDVLSDRAEIPRDVLRQSFSDIEYILNTGTAQEQGRALEAFTIKVGRRLGLDFTGWRLRSNETGGSEVDVIMERADLTHERWQIQCKRSTRLTLEHVAREVGVAHTTNATTILMLTMEGLTDDARQFADRIMQDANLSILFINIDDVSTVSDPEYIRELLKGESARAKRCKQLTANDPIVDAADEQSALNRHAEDLAAYRDDDSQVDITNFIE